MTEWLHHTQSNRSERWLVVTDVECQLPAPSNEQTSALQQTTHIFPTPVPSTPNLKMFPLK